jgi:hypothetical protein
MAGMSDDADLTRLFAEAPDLSGDDDAFVIRVTARIAWRRRLVWLMPAGAAAALLLAIWATWPAAYDFSRNALAGIGWIGDSIAIFANSELGMLLAAALLVTGLIWRWTFDQVRGSSAP